MQRRTHGDRLAAFAKWSICCRRSETAGKRWPPDFRRTAVASETRQELTPTPIVSLDRGVVEWRDITRIHLDGGVATKIPSAPNSPAVLFRAGTVSQTSVTLNADGLQPARRALVQCGGGSVEEKAVPLGAAV